jgi:aspartate/methionine/tyrosine aminotransferase
MNYNISNRLLNEDVPIIHQIKNLISERRSHGKEVIDFNQALVEFPFSSAIDKNSAEVASYLTEINKFEPLEGNLRLRQEVARYRMGAFSNAITENNVLITLGGNEGTLIALTGLGDPGDEVVLPSPYFFNHKSIISLLGLRERPLLTKKETNFQLSLDDLAEAWSPLTKVVLLSDPNNPTGTIMNAGIKLQVEEFVREQKGALLIDESFFPFDYRENPTPPIKLNLDTSILIGSFSKSFSLSGERVGYLIASEEFISGMLKVQDAFVISPSTRAQCLALDSLTYREEYLPRVLAEMKTRHTALKSILNRSRLFESVTGEGGVFLFPKLSGTMDCQSMATSLLTKGGIATVPGCVAGDGARGYLRFAFGQTRVEQIERAADLLDSFADS